MRSPKLDQAPPASLAATRHVTKQVPFSWLKPAPYNARRVSPGELHAICASLVQFGQVDPFVARAEDGLLIAGHQRREAMQFILDGKYLVDEQGHFTPNGKPAKLDLPDGKVWAVCMEGLSDRDAKRLNLALNKLGGTWDDDKLADLMKDLSQVNYDDLAVTGFSSDEIDKMLRGDEPAQMPPPAARAPKLTIEFSSKTMRDAVKGLIAGKTKANELSGDALARMVIKAKKAD